jgi:hypothetical protein
MCFNEAYCNVLIGNYLSDTFNIQNGLNKWDALLPLVFEFALE